MKQSRIRALAVILTAFLAGSYVDVSQLGPVIADVVTDSR